MYIADLHIHSKYSRATSKECIPEFLDLWARRKGIDLIGTGDFTHPAWRAELKEKLEPAEEGFYILKKGLQIEDELAGKKSRTRFVLTGEISSIYKKNGKVRKVHNLILLPGMDDAETLALKLETIGNLHSDGRPILGLDSHDLLEILLDTCPGAVLVPAHIWTPHFSVFGAFSGFDTLEECFEELTPHIHALETGLSSDPEMNRRLSSLDGYNLISNSDAHSPAKLGREANLFDTGFSYTDLARAIQGGKREGFAGTIEFFPEEGKYHYDGHRNCDLCLTPAETLKFGGICPVCGKKLTIGVEHRVEELADREKGIILPDEAGFESLIPLPEVIAASTMSSVTSAKTEACYKKMLRELGPEFHILREAALDDIERTGGIYVREGVKKLRARKVDWMPGYDGKYGKFQLLSRAEMDSLSGQLNFFLDSGFSEKSSKQAGEAVKRKEASESKKHFQSSVTADLMEGLNKEQKDAVTAIERFVEVTAGPGTGKTKTLTGKIAYLIEQRGVKPSEITAVTFTNKAAGEMKKRLEDHFDDKRITRAITIGTFHSICYEYLSKKEEITLIDNQDALLIADVIIREQKLDISARNFLKRISEYKNGLMVPDEKFLNSCKIYENELKNRSVMDFDDLLLKTLDIFGENGKKEYTPFSYLLVDEFQDINDIQFKLIKKWNEKGKNLFIIGDKDQSIYGFRGAAPECFERLKEELAKEGKAEQLKEITLTSNYRSTPEILKCAVSVIQNGGQEPALKAEKKSGARVRIISSGSGLEEGIFIAKEINRRVGGIDMLSAQDRMPEEGGRSSYGFSDFAVLYRTHRQAKTLEHCLSKEGIPFITYGRENYLSDKDVRGAVCFFKFLQNPWDFTSLEYCLKNVWNCTGERTAAFCDKLKKDSVSGNCMENMEEKYSGLMKESPIWDWYEKVKYYEPRIKRAKPVRLLEQWAAEHKLEDSKPFDQFIHMSVFYKDTASMMRYLLLGEEGDLRRGSGKKYTSGAVHLMTLHGAKGLQFPVVFISGVEKGLIPLELPGDMDIEEERRLFYVGMTRAEENLILTAAKEESGFLKNIPEKYIERGAARDEKRSGQGKQLTLFDFI